MLTASPTTPADHLRNLATPLWEQTVAHPYLRELQQGTLPLETFRCYVQQDWLYLQEFTRAAAVIAGRCPDPALMKVLLSWVEPLVTMEYHFHRQHAEQLRLDVDHVTWEMNAATWAYTRHMLAAAHTGSTAEALAALLPCPCVYAFVGERLSAGAPSPHPLYAEWIAFYAPGHMDTPPGAGVPVLDRDARIVAIQRAYDQVAAGADEATLARCARNYLISSRYEWWFWDAAYRRQSWPI